MTLTNIRFFVEAAKCENFTQAARQLYVSQPALSKQIAQLEQEVGVLLFERVNRSVRLTNAGRYLYEQFRDLPATTDHALEYTRAIGRGVIGDLSIGILEGQEINDPILMRLHEFGLKAPTLDIRLERNGFSNLRNGLLNNHYDLIITLLFEAKSIPGVQYIELLQQYGVIAISRHNPKAMINELSLSMLAEENFIAISPDESPNGYAMLLEQCKNAGFTPHIVRLLNSLESLLLCVEAGMGITTLDQNTRLEHNTEVRSIPIPNSAPSSVCAVWLETNRNQTVRQLVTELQMKRDS